MGDLHAELVIAACWWLKRKTGAKHVYAEPSSINLSEMPDAIGYYAGTWKGPTVVEVKTSVADFKRDASKTWRHGEKAGLGWCGMGERRYYLIPEGLIPVEDIPDDHGLLHAVRKGSRLLVKEIREAPTREKRDTGSELSWLGTALWRWEHGIPWFPELFRFATEQEVARMTTPRQRKE